MIGVAMNHTELVAREGWPFIVLGLLLSGLLYWLGGFPGLAIGGLITIFCVYFFRNPERKVESTRGIVVAPADGRIMDVVTIAEENYLHTDTIRIRIFLSLFNVHINRAPLAGKVEWVKTVSGEYLPAYKDEVSSKNARNYVGLMTDWGKVLVVQITGLIARRLVCWVKPGDTLATGQRFGLIRFGSCTEVYLPQDATVLVQPGQRVKGGETVIARLHR
jgi:phosphatidylserine decarboxylase